jgi:uncharacterized repeat protein (TIGR01451 family)
MAAPSPILPFEELRVTIFNTATIDSNETPPVTDRVDVPLIAVVDPRITKQMDPTRAQVGDEITIVLIAQNYGNANATQVVIHDQLPLELDLLSVSPPPGSTLAAVYGPGGAFSVTLGVLAPDQVVVVTALARVNQNAHPLPLTIVNAATLEFDEGGPRISNDTTVNIPTRDGGGSDDDEDDLTPLPSPTPISTPVLIIVATPAVLSLPETGVGRPPTGTGLPSIALVAVAVAVTMLARLVKRR